MFKKMIAFMLCFVMIAAIGMPAGARTETLTTADGLRYQIQDNEVTVIGHTDVRIRSLTIPETLSGKPVTAIDDLAFWGFSLLTSVSLPETINTIGMAAFAMCSSLTDIVIPEGVKGLEQNTFILCKNLKTVTFPDSLERIGQDVFNHCEALTELHFPKNLQQIASNALSSTNSLTDIQVDDNNPYYTDIDGILFSKDLSVLIHYPSSKPGETYILPQSVTKVNDYAFHENHYLKSVTFPCDLSYVGSELFSNCSNLETVVFSGKVTSFGQETFDQCVKLKSVTLPEGLLTIPLFCFSACESLAEIDLPEGLITINNSAFQRCKSLQSIRLPDSVTRIEDGAFSSCKSLTNVTLGSRLEYIGSYAFSDCPELKTIYIPPNVTEIASNAVGMVSGEKMADFTIDGQLGSSAEIYAIRYGFNFLYHGASYFDEATGIRVILAEEDALKDATITVTKEQIEEKTYRYTIQLTDANGVAIAPTQPFRMYIPIEEELVTRFCRILQVEEDQSQTQCDYITVATNQGTLFTFVATRLNQFIIDQEIISSHYGDPTADSKVDALDALYILKHSVGKFPFTPQQQIQADVSADKRIDAADALLVLKFSVYKITRFPADAYPLPTPPDATGTDATPVVPPFGSATEGDVIA